MLKQNLISTYLKDKPLVEIFLTGSIIALFLQSIGFALKYFSQVIIAQWLGTQEYGNYASIYSWIEVFALLCGAGFKLSVLRFIPQYKATKELKKLHGIIKFSQSFVFAVAILFLLFGIVIIQLDFITKFESSLITIGLMIVPVLSLSLLRVEIFRGFKELVKAYFPFMILYPIIWIIVVSILRIYFVPLTSIHVLLSLFLALIALIVIQSILLNKLTGLLPTIKISRFSTFPVREWFIVSTPLFLITIINIIQGKADILLISLLLSPISTGIYLAITKTVLLASFILIAANAIVAPLIVELHTANDTKQLQYLVKVTTGLTTIVALGATIFLILFGQEILGLFGLEFRQGFYALVILLFGQLINACAGPVGYLVTLTGFQSIAAKVYGASLVLNITLLLLLIPNYGIIGAAIATSITMLTWNVMLSFVAKYKLNINTFIFLIRKA